MVPVGVGFEVGRERRYMTDIGSGAAVASDSAVNGGHGVDCRRSAFGSITAGSSWDLVAIGRALVVRQGSRKPVSRDTTFVERPLGASLLVGRGSDREWYGYMSALKEAPTPRPFDCAPLDVRGLIAGALHDMPHRLVPSDWRLPDIPRGQHGMADEGRQPAPNRRRSSAPFRAPRRTLKIP